MTDRLRKNPANRDELERELSDVNNKILDLDASIVDSSLVDDWQDDKDFSLLDATVKTHIEYIKERGFVRKSRLNKSYLLERTTQTKNIVPTLNSHTLFALTKV